MFKRQGQTMQYPRKFLKWFERNVGRYEKRHPTASPGEIEKMAFADWAEGR